MIRRIQIDKGPNDNSGYDLVYIRYSNGSEQNFFFNKEDPETKPIINFLERLKKGMSNNQSKFMDIR